MALGAPGGVLCSAGGAQFPLLHVHDAARYARARDVCGRLGRLAPASIREALLPPKGLQLGQFARDRGAAWLSEIFLFMSYYHYSKNARIIINDIDVANAAAFPVCFKNNVVINNIEKIINSTM